MKKRYIVAALAVLYVLAFGDLEFRDEHDVMGLQAQQYCEMVAIWKDAAAQGTPIDQRDGWPDYRENYEEVCL